MVMLKNYDTIFVYNAEVKTFWNETDQVLLSNLLPSLHTLTTGRSPWPYPRNRGTLTDDEVRLPSRLQDFPIGFDYEIIEGLYGFTETWLSFVRSQATRGVTFGATLAPPGATTGSVTSHRQTSAASSSPPKASDTESAARVLLSQATETEPVSIAPLPQALNVES